MAITETRVPSNNVEIDNARAVRSPVGLDYKVLIMGQGTDAGSATVKTLTPLINANDASAKFGRGSMIHRMAIAYFANNQNNEVEAIAATMDPVATPTNKAAGSIQFTAGPSVDGVYIPYIAGERIAVSVAAGDTVAQLSAKLKAEIDANHIDLPVKSTDDSVDTVDFEALNIGVTGDDITIKENQNTGESLPAGLATTITAMTGGAADPDLSAGSPSVIDNLGDEWFQIWANPYNDSTNIPVIQAELDRRFPAKVEIDGIAIGFKKDTVGNLTTFGLLYNTEQLVTFGIYNNMKWTVEMAAAAVGRIARQLSEPNGPEAKPFQTLELIGVDAPPKTDRFLESERDTLLKNGIATVKIDASSKVRIERTITMYRLDATSTPDTSWLDANTRFTAMFIRWDWKRRLGIAYPQSKLAGDDNLIGAGQIVMTPKAGKAFALGAFLAWAKLGLVEGLEQFKTDLKAYRNEADPNAFNWEQFPDFVNQFRVSYTTQSFLL